MNLYKLYPSAHGIFPHSISKLETTQLSTLRRIHTQGNGQLKHGAVCGDLKGTKLN